MVAALTYGGGSAEEVHELSEILLLLPLLYLVVAKLHRRWTTWPLLAAGFALVLGLRLVELIPLPAVLPAIALVVLVWGAADGDLFRSGTFQVQALGTLAFMAAGLAGLAIAPEAARYLVAAGWFFHGVWDLVHLRLDRAVSRSFAEWCAVIDIWIAAELLGLI
ncbi:hypothetical protein GCM10009605_11070 [Nocardiopsis composta]